MEIMQYLKQPEGKTLEFKRDLSSPDKVLRTVAGFANTAGGVLLIGVEDGTRAVRGVTHPLEEEERLANLIADGISPQVVPDGDPALAQNVHPFFAYPPGIQSAIFPAQGGAG